MWIPLSICMLKETNSLKIRLHLMEELYKPHAGLVLIVTISSLAILGNKTQQLLVEEQYFDWTTSHSLLPTTILKTEHLMA